MGLTSRKKRPLDRTIPHLRSTRLIVVGAEGEITEGQYFGMFRDSRVQVLVLPTVGGKSSPRHVLARLGQFEEEFELAGQDQLWVMIDTDRWTKKMLSEVAQGAQQQGFRMAVSNPCFEVWLYLHKADLSWDDRYNCRRMKHHLAHILGGYDHTNLQTDKFEPHVVEAVQRAKALDDKPDERWPTRIGTHVYRVVEEILRLMGVT